MNNQQILLNKKLDEFINHKYKNYLLITGSAGSGKTTTISNFFLQQKLYTLNEVIILTPTHKAKHIIRKKTNNKFECLTIHKFLGYSRKVDENGKISFIIKVNPDVENVKVVIIDECSMVNKFNFEKLRTKINKMNIKAIFMGDPNQLPPINENLSETFEIPNKFHLDKSLRNKGKILNICNHMLSRLNKKNIKLKKFDKKIRKEGEIEEVKLYQNSIDYIKDIVKNKDLDYKVLCWTNAQCNKMNRIIRNNIYGYECKKFCNNEKLLVKNYFINQEKIIFTTNEEFIVKKVSEKEIRTSDFDFIPKKYQLDIEGGIKIFELQLLDTVLYVVKEEYREIIENILQNIKKDAQYSKSIKNITEAISLWELYYRVREIFLPNIEYNYAITIHRSQGSEWDLVYVELRDIMKNRKIIERNKLIYTAFSRCMNKLIIKDD